MLRKDVFIARTGGEEFAMIVEGNNQDEVDDDRRARPHRA